MTTVRRALAISMGERYVLIGIALIGNMLLARLLTPEEIGIYSVSLALIGIAQVMRDFGIGNFLIQEKNLNDGHIRTAFGISLLIGGLLFLVIFFGASWAGSFYGETRMVDTMRITSLNFLVLPFCTISLALLRRDMLFARLAKVTLSAAIIGFAVMVSLAYLGFGANSMAIGAVATNVATGMGAWLARTDRQLLLPALTEWRALLNFGGQSALANVVTTISMDINDLAIGKILGFAPVAMVSRAQGLMNLFHRDIMGAVRNVAFPAFADTHRQGHNLESRYIFSVAGVTAVAWPFYMFASLYALELLRLLFGPQWDAAAVMVPWFCLAGAIAATCNLIIPLLIAQGHIKQATKLDLVLQPIRAVSIVITVWVFQTQESFAIAFFINAVLALPYHYYIKSIVQTNDYKSLINTLSKSAVLTLISSVPPVLIYFFAPRNNEAIMLPYVILSAFLCGVFWIYGMVYIKHPLANDVVFKRALFRWVPFLNNS